MRSKTTFLFKWELQFRLLSTTTPMFLLLLDYNRKSPRGRAYDNFIIYSFPKWIKLNLSSFKFIVLFRPLYNTKHIRLKACWVSHTVYGFLKIGIICKVFQYKYLMTSSITVFQIMNIHNTVLVLTSSDSIKHNMLVSAFLRKHFIHKLHLEQFLHRRFGAHSVKCFADIKVLASVFEHYPQTFTTSWKCYRRCKGSQSQLSWKVCWLEFSWLLTSWKWVIRDITTLSNISMIWEMI